MPLLLVPLQIRFSALRILCGKGIDGCVYVYVHVWGVIECACRRSKVVRVDLDLPECYTDRGKRYFLHGLYLGFCPRQAKWFMLPDHPGRGQADPASRGLEACRFNFLTRCLHSEGDPKGAKEVPGTLTHGWYGKGWGDLRAGERLRRKLGQRKASCGVVPAAQQDHEFNGCLNYIRFKQSPSARACQK